MSHMLRDRKAGVRRFEIRITGVTDGNRTEIAAIATPGLSPLEARGIMRQLALAPFPDPPGTPPLMVPDDERRP